MVFQARALDRVRFKRKIGDLERAFLNSVQDELQKLIGRKALSEGQT